MQRRQYQYVGPCAVGEAARAQRSGTPIRTTGDLCRWIEQSLPDVTVEGHWVATFTISTDQTLYLAPRRSEHVACAAGGPVLSAGELTLDRDRNVVGVSNQSTGFCPEPESWPAVESALNQVGLNHPGRFTTAVIFRLCPKCNQSNIAKDSWYYCQICDAKLPDKWNFGDTPKVG